MNVRYLTTLIIILTSVNGYASTNSYHLNDDKSEVLVTAQQVNRTVISINIGELQYEENTSASDNDIRISLPEEFDLSRGAILGPGNTVIPTITRKIAVPFRCG